MEAPEDDANDAQRRDNRHKNVHAALPSKLNPSTAATIAAHFSGRASNGIVVTAWRKAPPSALVQLANHDKGVSFTPRNSSAKSLLLEQKMWL
jgi:hypothetical protein